MKVFWIAGEPSGDLQASALIRAFAAKHPEIIHAGWGGQEMKNAGMQLLQDLTAQPLMGYVEVLKKATTIVKQLQKVKDQIRSFDPSVVVLVDYAGFNLKIAQWAHEKGLKVVYFIPPKMWAWKERRLERLMTYSDEVLTILPFEQQWFRQRGHDAPYVGNPLMERYRDLDLYKESSRKIALLPGSRMQEVRRLLPVFAELASALPEYDFHIVRAPSVRKTWPALDLSQNISVCDDSIKTVVQDAEFALTCSGTASLEIALLGIPQAVVYKANPLSLAIAKRLVKVRFFSLPNLVLDREMVPELLQGDVNMLSLKKIITSEAKAQLKDIELLKERMDSVNLQTAALPRILALMK